MITKERREELHDNWMSFSFATWEENAKWLEGLTWEEQVLVNQWEELIDEWEDVSLREYEEEWLEELTWEEQVIVNKWREKCYTEWEEMIDDILQKKKERNAKQ